MSYKYNPFTGNFDRVGGSGADPVETITGNSGGPVAPTNFNIDLLGAGKYSVTGNPGTSTLTIDDDGTIADTYVTDSGSATPSANSINILGGTGINTSGSGDTVTINLDDPVIVDNGGSGRTSATAYAVICGGTTSTNPHQSIASVGTSGQVLTSNGAGALPTFEDSGGGGGFTLGTVQTTTSGTSFNFGSIPSGTSQIVVSFNQISLGTTDNLLVQIGDSGGIETSGYVSQQDNGTSSSSTSAFIVARIAAANAYSGQLTLTLFDDSTFSWSAVGTILNTSGTIGAGWCSGDKSLSDELTQLTVTTSGGVTWDGGSVNIAYI